jgi:hypothetical protein
MQVSIDFRTIPESYYDSTYTHLPDGYVPFSLGSYYRLSTEAQQQAQHATEAQQQPQHAYCCFTTDAAQQLQHASQAQHATEAQQPQHAAVVLPSLRPEHFSTEAQQAQHAYCCVTTDAAQQLQHAQQAQHAPALMQPPAHASVSPSACVSSQAHDAHYSPDPPAHV